ncbi:hypothetical protein NDU88_005442 [Pleurodeles waltl]|uniref:Uncharacterized protein n=1 Tax=Pleurodeles waltl TaxID=8319 RepID=A0AAV7TAN9_PLEWA|nr:hypothetical protein NDU88_005442 [Pleurodeles waltl]
MLPTETSVVGPSLSPSVPFVALGAPRGEVVAPPRQQGLRLLIFGRVAPGGVAEKPPGGRLLQTRVSARYTKIVLPGPAFPDSRAGS